MEGINHEAIGLAGHLKLGRLIVLWDDNRITIDGSTDLSTSEDVRARYAATGWHVESCDGHDPADIRSEEHTSELQSLMRISYAVFCLKKKNKKQNNDIYRPNNTKNSVTPLT